MVASGFEPPTRAIRNVKFRKKRSTNIFYAKRPKIGTFLKISSILSIWDSKYAKFWLIIDPEKNSQIRNSLIDGVNKKVISDSYLNFEYLFTKKL